MTRAIAEFRPDGSCIKALLQKAHARGYVKIEELMTCIPPEIIEQDQIDDIISMIEDGV